MNEKIVEKGRTVYNIAIAIVSMAIMSVAIVKNIINSDVVACTLQALEMHKRNTLFLSTFHESSYIHLHTYAIWIALFFTDMYSYYIVC